MTFNKKEWSKKYYLRNKKRILERNKKWNRNNPDKMRIISKRYAENNPEKVKEREIRYYLENPDRRKAQWKKYRENHKGLRRVYMREYFKMNPSAQHRYKKGQAIGKFTIEEWQDLKRKYNFRCAICKKRKKLTVDHKIPLSKGGTNFIDNIQPLCKSCNCSKGNHI